MADELDHEALEEPVADATGVGDVDMVEGEEEAANGIDLPLFGDGLGGGGDDEAGAHTPFVSYLTSPIVTLLVGNPGAETILTAHEALLTQSPFFQEACAAFGDDGSPRQIELTNEDTDAVGSFLEFLYTGEYFPRQVAGERSLEADPSIPAVDETGDQLLKHARVYTIAEKFGLEKLRSLASSKIHLVNSTAKGEIAYARYVYEYTSPDDKTIRAPVAGFWASRSHTLRAEAEDEFKALCLEFPQFGYDVLTRVLNEKLKRERSDKPTPVPGSARKRARQSNV